VIYREAGQFKTSYAKDQAIFSIRQDRYWMVLVALFAFVVIPAFGTPYFLEIIMLNFLFFSIEIGRAHV
jgi:branched-chain amino acid transport system permease protein